MRFAVREHGKRLQKRFALLPFATFRGLKVAKNAQLPNINALTTGQEGQNRSCGKRRSKAAFGAFFILTLGEMLKKPRAIIFVSL